MFSSFKRIFIILASILAFFADAKPQVIIVLAQPPFNQIKSENLWKLQLNNASPRTYKVFLNGVITEVTEGKIFEARSSAFELSPGFHNITMKDLGNISIISSRKEFEEMLIRSGTIKEGDYEICVTVLNVEDNNELGKDCISHSVIHPNPPQLISPSNGIESEIEINEFSWTPITPQISGINYLIKIVEIQSGQSLEEAIQNNLAWFEKSDIKSNILKYPTSARKFEKGKKYAWQITAFTNKLEIGKSEVWSFSPGDRPTLMTFWGQLQDVSPKGCYNICCHGDTTDQKFVFRILHSQPIDLGQSGFSIVRTQTCCGVWNFGAPLSTIILNGWGELNNIRAGTSEFIFYPFKVDQMCLCDGDRVQYQLSIHNAAGNPMLGSPYNGFFIVDLTGPSVIALVPPDGSGVSVSGFTVNINVQDLPNCGVNFSGVANGFGYVELKDGLGTLIAKYVSESYFSFHYGDISPPPVMNRLNWNLASQTFSLNFPPTHFINPLPSPLSELRFCLTMWDDCGNLIGRSASTDGKTCLSTGEPFCWKYHIIDSSSCNWPLIGTPFKEKSINPDTKVLIGGGWVDAYEIPCSHADCGAIAPLCRGWGRNCGCIQLGGGGVPFTTCPWYPLYDRGACWVSSNNPAWRTTLGIISDIFKHDFIIPPGMIATNVVLRVLSDDTLHVFLDPPNPAAPIPGTAGYIATQNGHCAPFGGLLINLPNLSSGLHTLSFILVNARPRYYGFIYGLDYDLAPPEDTTCNCGNWNPVNVNWVSGSAIVPRGGTINTGALTLGTNITINTSFNCNPATCLPTYNWRITGPAAFLSAGTAIPFTFTPTTAGTYFVTIIPQCGTSPCDTFWFRINIDSLITQDNCTCRGSSWGAITMNWLSSSIVVVPGTTFNPGTIPSGTTFTVIPSFNCTPPSCPVSFTWRMNLDGVAWIPTSSLPIVFTPPRPGVYTVIITPSCGLIECNATWFKIEIPNIDETCSCINWDPINVSWLSTTTTVTNGGIINIGALPSGTPITINTNYNCSPPSCLSVYSWRIFGGGSTWTGTTLPISFTPLVSGEYSVYLTSSCGGTPCDTIKFKIRIGELTEDCGCVGGDNFIISYDYGSVMTYPCGSTLTATHVGSSIAINRIIACEPTLLCPPNQNLTIYKDGSPIGFFPGITLPYNYTFTSIGNYTFVISGNCGTARCDTCHFSINVEEMISDTCICRDWRFVRVRYGSTVSNVNCLPGGGVSSIDIGSIPVGTPINITFNVNCFPSHCTTTYNYVITGPGGTSGTFTGIVGNISFIPTASTTYDVILNATCAGHVCNPCRFKIYVNLIGSLCDYGTIEIKYSDKIITFFMRDKAIDDAPRRLHVFDVKAIDKNNPITISFIYARAMTDCCVIERPSYLISGPRGFTPISGVINEKIYNQRTVLTSFSPLNQKGEPLSGPYDVSINWKINGIICPSFRFKINVLK